MLEIYEFFQDEFPGVNVSFEPLNPIGRGEHSTQIPPLEDEFLNGYLSILEKYGSTHIGYSAISTVANLRDRFCTPVARPNMNVSVDGRLHSCARSGVSEKFFFGEFDAEKRRFVVNAERVEKLRNVSVKDFLGCSDCFARFNCAGDCHDLRDAGFYRCNINKGVLLWHLRNELKMR
jgi:uncharacterized protein